MLMEHQARKFANQWVEDRKLGEAVAARAIQGERFWFFYVGEADDEIHDETIAVAVEKLRGGVTRPAGAWLEFVPNPSVSQRIARWWNRMKY